MDHLGVVGGICQEIGSTEQIDWQVVTFRRKVSCVEVVLTMVLDALGFTSRMLYLMLDYL